MGPKNPWDRLTGPFNNQNFGAWLSLVWPFLIAFYRKTNNFKKNFPAFFF
ncbi:MAG: hypothetical protein CM15mP13_3010 [Pseudomonadota bacterium]|nr:MAG: hypothetical protein CM15mP13_3010 [Pseudomonadota bacterium]